MEDEFYRLMGQALERWQYVEADVVRTYSIAVKSRNTNALIASFHKVVSITSKLDMVDEAVRFSDLDDTAKSRWKTLSNRIRKASRKRNYLVHWTITTNTMHVAGEQVFITANVFNPANNKSWSEREKFYSRDLRSWAAEWNSLHNDLRLYLDPLPT